jgi:ActR/RegA family two-component response regulator
MKKMVLVLDDDPNIRGYLRKHIKNAGYEICTAATVEEANTIMQVETIDFAIIDLKVDYSSDCGGIKAIENINKRCPAAKVLVFSGHELNPDIKDQLAKVYYESFIWKGGATNTIKAVIDELKRLTDAPPKKTCFVIMPFSDTNSCTKKQWTEIFETMIKSTVEEFDYYKCFRASLEIGNIIKDILINLNRSDVVIADLTDRNSNVFYELGVRHALRDATILITQNIEHVPFDLRHYALVLYDWTTRSGREEFKTRIHNILACVEEKPQNSNLTSPVREYLKLDGNSNGSKIVGQI